MASQTGGDPGFWLLKRSSPGLARALGMRDLFALNSIDQRLVDEKTEQRDAAREAVTSAQARVQP